jgi:hypothetical protein
MSTQVRQSFSAAQPIARRIRTVCRSLCKSICARDLQGVSPSDRIIRLGTGVAVQEVPVPDPSVLHRVVRAIPFSRLNHDAMKTQCEATEHMGLAQTALSIARFQLCLPKSVLHASQARAMAVGPHRLHSHLNRYFPATFSHYLQS